MSMPGNRVSGSTTNPFAITVSPDSIDPYISYRLIAPSYVTYEELTINQRSCSRTIRRT